MPILTIQVFQANNPNHPDLVSAHRELNRKIQLPANRALLNNVTQRLRDYHLSRHSVNPFPNNEYRYLGAEIQMKYCYIEDNNIRRDLKLLAQPFSFPGQQENDLQAVANSVL